MSVVSQETSAADRVTFLALRRNGSTVGCSARTVRVSLTLSRETFAELRSLADQQHRSISRQAARLLVRGLAQTLGGIPDVEEALGSDRPAPCVCTEHVSEQKS